MVVPNYIPDPIEIPGNVTEQPYRVRLTFIRRVLSLHLLSAAGVVGVALSPIPMVGLPTIALCLLIMLVLACFVRINMRGKKAEVIFSIVLLPGLLVLVGLTLKALGHAGLPVWSMAVGLIAAYTYALICGRDFSFVGQLVLALIASSTFIAGISLWLGHPGLYAAEALGLNAAYLIYYVYDAASLMSRRRLGEELAAVVDLYRDVLNFFGYVPRVVHHWHKHRIWQLR